MKRKTFDIINLIDEINRRNMGSTCAPEVRTGWNIMLEHILHETGNYRGYRYLELSEVPAGHLPGIIWGKDEKRTDYPKSIESLQRNTNTFPDESRRAYYYTSEIAKGKK